MGHDRSGRGNGFIVFLDTYSRAGGGIGAFSEERCFVASVGAARREGHDFGTTGFFRSHGRSGGGKCRDWRNSGGSGLCASSFADAIGPQDLGMIVRVQLTRASLTELGYPVADSLNTDEDLISAEVLVGEDGWPRAVKVIQ